jgi:hypothetical protein
MLDVVGAPSLDALIAHVPARCYETMPAVALAPGLTSPTRRVMERMAAEHVARPDRCGVPRCRSVSTRRAVPS